VARAAGGTATFDFDELFGQAVGAADFLALASAFHTVAVRDVPRLDSSRHNEARRFITFVDILYENQARLVVTCAVPLRSLFRPLEVGVGPDRRVDRDAMVDGRVLRAAARSGTASAADPAATLAGMTLAGGDVGREPLRSGLTEASPTRLDLDRPRQRIVSSRETAVAGTAVALGTTTRTGASEDERDAEFTMARLFEAAPGQGSDGVDPAAEVWVKDQGGSSGRVTTMIGQAEWSATGRLGVSLAEFSAVKDVAFSFHRALSRLVEMQSPPYLEAHRAKHRLLSADAALQRREK
jgi:predicted ATPase